MDTSTTTRKQLRGYGASRYLARKVTEPLDPIGKAGSAYVYALDQAIAAIRDYSERSRIHSETKQTLNNILSELLPRLDNVVNLPAAEQPSEIGKLAQRAMKAMRRTDKAMAEMKAMVASIGEHSS